MVRPRWKPTDDQKKLIALAVRAFDEAKAAEQRAWEAAAAARDGGVYPKHLADHIEPSASKIYRHIGPDEHTDEAAAE